MAKMAKREDSRSRMVQVAPNERIARQGNETDAQVRARHAREQRELDRRIARNQEDSRFYERRDRTTDPLQRLNFDIARAAGRRFAKGGAVKGTTKGGSASKRGDGIAQRGKTKGRFV